MEVEYISIYEVVRVERWKISCELNSNVLIAKKAYTDRLRLIYQKAFGDKLTCVDVYNQEMITLLAESGLLHVHKTDLLHRA